jgi:hypothetical protein
MPGPTSPTYILNGALTPLKSQGMVNFSCCCLAFWRCVGRTLEIGNVHDRLETGALKRGDTTNEHVGAFFLEDEDASIRLIAIDKFRQRAKDVAPDRLGTLVVAANGGQYLNSGVSDGSALAREQFDQLGSEDRRSIIVCSNKI